MRRDQAQPRGEILRNDDFPTVASSRDLATWEQPERRNADDAVVDATPEHEIRSAEDLDAVEHDLTAVSHRSLLARLRSRYTRTARRTLRISTCSETCARAVSVNWTWWLKGVSVLQR